MFPKLSDEKCLIMIKNIRQTKQMLISQIEQRGDLGLTTEQLNEISIDWFTNTLEEIINSKVEPIPTA